MEKKYQVFISSTYEDLKEERFAVMQSLLDFDCIPVGMEQFPASDMSQMEYIEKLIDECDYYLLILAGKYGSTDNTGLGYTEMEYNYALSKNIPIMRHVIKDLSTLEKDKCEEGEKADKLIAFRKKVCDEKLVKFFTDVSGLKYNVVQTLRHYIKAFPRNGWIRSDSIEVNHELEQSFENYMETHTVTSDDIERLFRDDVIILDGGNSLGCAQNSENLNSRHETKMEISLPEGITTMVQTFAERAPDVLERKKNGK